jgi:transcriptional regulator with XRE-family HTH domain
MKTAIEVLDPIDIHVGTRIRELRAEQRVTQAQLATALGVSFQQVQKYERGVNRMAASTLAKAAGALGCQIGDFFPSASSASDMSPAEAAGEIESLYSRMGPRQREALLMTARAMAYAQP